MSRVSTRLAHLPPSATLGIAGRAREMRAAGVDVISFGAGEPDFPTPEHVVAAAARACHDPVNHKYTAAAGLPELRRAIADDIARFSRVQVDSSEVMVTNGAKQAVFQGFAALLDPGDEVLLPSPHWVTYPAGIDMAGGVTVSVPTRTEDGFKVSVEALEAARTDRTKLLVFVSPSNPTGAVYTAEEAKAIGEWAASHGIWVMADEIYQRLTYFTDVAPSIAAVTPRFENWVLINGVAKSYSMTGWRVGWMVGPQDVIEAANAHQSHATGNVANVSQVAAIAALTGPQETVEEMRRAFDARRKLMYSMVSSIPGVECVEPEGAFYVFPDFSAHLGERWETSDQLAESILEEAAVALVPGESFGAPGFLRLSYATGEEQIEAGIDRIAALLAG